MRTVTLTELRRNLEAYIDETKESPIRITRYGKAVAILQNIEAISVDSDTTCAVNEAGIAGEQRQ